VVRVIESVVPSVVFLAVLLVLLVLTVTVAEGRICKLSSFVYSAPFTIATGVTE